MNLLEIVEIRDKLKAELAIVEKFLEIAKQHGANGANGSSSNGSTATVVIHASSNAVPTPSPNHPELPGTEREYGAIASVVKEAINLCPEKYTIRDVSGVLTKINKPLSKLQIATVLTRFARKEQIHIHRRGKGSKPTVYRKTAETT